MGGVLREGTEIGRSCHGQGLRSSGAAVAESGDDQGDNPHRRGPRDPRVPRGVDLPDPDQMLLEMVGTAEDHGIRFPREFTLLIKQFLYFDSYRDLLFNMDFLMDEMMGKLDMLNQELGSIK